MSTFSSKQAAPELRVSGDGWGGCKSADRMHDAVDPPEMCDYRRDGSLASRGFAQVIARQGKMLLSAGVRCHNRGQIVRVVVQSHGFVPGGGIRSADGAADIAASAENQNYRVCVVMVIAAFRP